MLLLSIRHQQAEGMIRFGVNKGNEVRKDPLRRTLAARSDNAKEENEFCAIPLL